MEEIIEEVEVEINKENLEKAGKDLEQWNKDHNYQKISIFDVQTHNGKFFFILRVDKGSIFNLKEVVNKKHFPWVVKIKTRQTIDFKLFPSSKRNQRTQKE